MNNQWPKVRLAEVLIEQRQRIGSFDADNLPLLGVNNREGLHRSGMPRIGDMSRYLRVEKDWFAYNPMRVNVGSIGLAETDEQTGVISPDYVVFSCSARILPRLIFSFLKHGRGLREINGATAGSVRERLYFEKLGMIEFPLPPMAQQRRMAAYIERITAQIHEARTIRHQAVEETEALLRSILSHDERAKPTPMRELVRLRPTDVDVQADEIYQFAGVYCFGRGVFKGNRKSGLDFAYSRLTRLRAGEFVYPKLMAWEGALGVVPPECEDCVVSPEFPVFTINENRVFREVLDIYFRTPSVWPELAGGSTGTNVRRRRLNPQDFLNYEMPLPSQETQTTLRKVKAETDTLKYLQAETAAELDALLPAVLERLFRGQLAPSGLPDGASAITPIDAQVRPTFSTEDYFVQLIPALLRAVGGRLELDKLNAAVSLLFLPKILHPLIGSVGGPEARTHFDRFNQPLKDSAFVPMLHVLAKTGAITCVVSNQVTSLQLHESAAPPIKPVVEEDARFLAALVNLIPSAPVQATVSKLCPEPAKEELLAMA